MVVNNSVNKSTGYLPFFLMHGHHSVMPLELLRDQEESIVEPANEFLTRMDSTWHIAKETMNKAQERMKKYEDCCCRLINFEEGDRVLLSMQNLRFKNIPNKLRQRFVGPFRVEEKIGKSAYKLGLPDRWKIHDVFHVSLLKPW